MTAEDVKTVAERLLAAPVDSVQPAAHGGNSRVFRVAAGAKNYALKQYPSQENDTRDRLATEQRALTLMAAHGIGAAPRWIAGEAPYGLMSWADGSVITAPAESDIDEAAIFLGTLHHISGKMGADDAPLASEACLSGAIIASQLEKRVERLMPVTAENKALMQFLSQSFLPAFAKRLMAAKRALPDFSSELSQEKRTLIAADFGFHNMLKSSAGRITFIDFEYFGWDDPAKLMSDVLLHPATRLSPALQKHMHQHLTVIYGGETDARFRLLYPLFGLRWTLILLNEFLPERWQARQNTRLSAKGADAVSDWEKVKTEQLAKAEAMLKRSETFE